MTAVGGNRFFGRTYCRDRPRRQIGKCQPKWLGNNVSEPPVARMAPAYRSFPLPTRCTAPQQRRMPVLSRPSTGLEYSAPEIRFNSRPSDSRISSALLVQMKDLGWVFQSLIQARMSASSCWTVLR